MMSTRRLALSVLCSTSLAAALVAASPAVAVSPAQHRVGACGAAPGDVAGTFSGTFQNDPTATLSVTFAEPESVATQWSVQGWNGSGKGQYELSPTGPQWTNSDTLSGPITGVDSEVFRSVQVLCDSGTSQVTTIIGMVDAGNAQIPFSITRS